MGTFDEKNLRDTFKAQAAKYEKTREYLQKAREDFLANAIKTASKWIRSLKDPELGDVGRQFLDQTAKSGCKEKVDVSHTNSIASYCSFSYNPRGFLNQVTYGAAAEENLIRLFSSKIHETTHALQKMLSPALHASPFNPDTKIIICPRDWVMLEERCEQDAYAKQAYFSSLLAPLLPETRETMQRAPLTVEEFEKIRASTPTIGQAMIEAARQALNKSFYKNDPDAEYRFKNKIQDQALKNYEAGIALRQENEETNLIFVRLEPEDIAAIGASCGPNVFGEKGVLPEFLAHPVMLRDTQKKLNEINRSCGITDSDKLPTLSEALKKMGLTRQQFIAQADKHTPPPPSRPQP